MIYNAQSFQELFSRPILAIAHFVLCKEYDLHLHPLDIVVKEALGHALFWMTYRAFCRIWKACFTRNYFSKSAEVGLATGPMRSCTYF